MRRAKIISQNVQYEDGTAAYVDLIVDVDDAAGQAFAVGIAPGPAPEPATPLATEMHNVLVHRNDRLLAEIEKLKSTIDDRDEIIGQLAKDLSRANERMMQMFDKAMDVLRGD